MIGKNIFKIIPFLLLLTACGEKEAKKENRAIFRYNEMGGISSLDPAASSNTENIWVINQMFNGLIQQDDSLQIIPSIARSWTVSSDGLNYIFKLRKDVFFHDDECFSGGKGRRVTAQDFVYSFARLRDPKVSSALSLIGFFDVNKNGGSEALDDSTLAVYLKEPFSPLLGVLSMKFFSVVPKEAIEKYGEEFRNHPVGTGPFRFKLWEEGTKLVMLKNDNYFEFEKEQRLPYLDAVTVSFIRDKETSFMQFMKGDFDMISGLDAFNSKEVLDAEGNLKPFYKDKFILQTGPYVKTDYFGFLIDENLELVKKSPVKIKAVRQAINYGFDRIKLIRFFHNNLGIPAEAGFIPSGLMAYNPQKIKGYHYNPEKAKTLLKSAGFSNENRPVVTLHVTEGYVDIMEFFQAQMSEIGVDVKISVDQPTELKKAVNNNQIEFFKKSWVCDYADEENFMSLFYSKNFAPGGFNYFHYKNEKFDALYELALKEQHPIKRMELYQEMDNIVMQDAPIVPLYYDQVVRLVSKNVENFSINAMNLLNLKTVKKGN
jgi:peptide/nickel transport system substrate-binding protein